MKSSKKGGCTGSSVSKSISKDVKHHLRDCADAGRAALRFESAVGAPSSVGLRLLAALRLFPLFPAFVPAPELGGRDAAGGGFGLRSPREPDAFPRVVEGPEHAEPFLLLAGDLKSSSPLEVGEGSRTLFSPLRRLLFKELRCADEASGGFSSDSPPLSLSVGDEVLVVGVFFNDELGPLRHSLSGLDEPW